MKKVKVLTLEVDHKIRAIIPHVRFIDSDNTLEEMYRLIGCDLIDIAQVKVGGKFFDVYCDDEFLLKDNPVPTLFIDNETVLCGNLIFTTRNDEGKAAKITNDDVKKLTNFLSKQENKLHGYFARLK